MSLKSNSNYEENMTLLLETWPDELSPAQLAAYEKAEKEHNDIRLKLNEIITASGGENIFSGDIFSAYQLTGISPALETISKPLAAISKQKQNYERSKPRYTYTPTKTRNSVVDKSIVIDDDEDEDDDLPLAKRSKKHDLKRGKDVKKNKSSSNLLEKPIIPAAVNVKPGENTATGGLQVGTDTTKKKDSVVVDLTKDETTGRIAADSREITFNKLQGKTFPSLVVTARPSLRVKDNVAADRASLDTKVKNVLMHTPLKFTEWLIQQGLVRSQQECQPQCGISLKLGMYSDSSKFPYSGGYVWISECCNPTRFVSVFNGSIFEGSSKPPSILLKLIYHWSCQTVVQNVVQWVKVDNTFVKEFYTKLRSICTLALYQHMTYMGGIGRRIEVGVISLGTTTQDGQQRQVKVEVLGVLDPDAKLIRLRAVEPLTDGERNQKKRFFKILEPLTQWVRTESIILTDLTVDKSTLHAMGYKTVYQSSSVDAKHNRFNNSNIMDYLRRIVPRMFQNTLSLLSRQIIQQFLDELVWREWYGTTPEKSFDNIVQHIAEQTRIDGKEQLSSRLDKVASNPFKKWNPQTLSKPVMSPLREALEATANKRRGTKRPIEPALPPILSNKKTSDKKEITKAPLKSLQPALTTVTSKAITGKKDIAEDYTSLESYYYGRINGRFYNHNAVEVDFKANCPECEQKFVKNTDFMIHIYTHVNPSKKDPCKYCLENFNPSEMRNKHVPSNHPCETKHHNLSYYRCVICEARFTTVLLLSGHMQRFHVPSEMPYKCSGCDYTTSSHKMVIDHFYVAHSKSGILQCPHCLKIFNCFVKGEFIMINVQMFMQHLRLHLIKAQCKKCNKCALWFTSKGSLKVHQLLSHASQVHRKKEIKPYSSTSTAIARPRVKATQSNASVYTLLESYDNVIIAVDNGIFCLECDEDFEEAYHIIGLMKCHKCNYQSSCLPSILEHASNCTGSSLPENLMLSPLDNEMHCICGFSCSEGYTLATHLARCDRRSAYPTVEVAQENTVKRNMLDMLGLVRRDNEGDDINDDSSQIKQHHELDVEMEPHVTEVENKPSLEEPEIPMDGNIEQNDETNISDQQQFTTQLSLDDLAPQSVMSTVPENDPTPQLKEDYQSLSTPRVSHHHLEAMNEGVEFEQLPSESLNQTEFESL